MRIKEVTAREELILPITEIRHSDYIRVPSEFVDLYNKFIDEMDYVEATEKNLLDKDGRTLGRLITVFFQFTNDSKERYGENDNIWVMKMECLVPSANIAETEFYFRVYFFNYESQSWLKWGDEANIHGLESFTLTNLSKEEVNEARQRLVYSIVAMLMALNTMQAIVPYGLNQSDFAIRQKITEAHRKYRAGASVDFVGRKSPMDVFGNGLF